MNKASLSIFLLAGGLAAASFAQQPDPNAPRGGGGPVPSMAPAPGTDKRTVKPGISTKLPTAAEAAEVRKDRGMFLGNMNRNNVRPAEKNLPTEWNLQTGQNILWSQPVGSQSYGGPVVAAGKVIVGTNNEGRRNPALGNDRGVVMAFNAADGKFLWQSTHEKLPETKLHDWPLQGVCSSPAVEDGKVYYVSNRAEVVAVDLEGFHDGENDGPYKDEKDKGEFAADILWIYDMMAEADVFPHNLAASSPLIVGDLLYVATGNGVDEGHANIPSPLAPSLMAFNKKTGELVWEDASASRNTLHGTWSNATYANAKNRPQIIFPAGNGWVYSMDPLTGEHLWQFDANPKDAVWRLGGSGTRNYLVAAGVVAGDAVYFAVGQDPEHGEAPGHFYAVDVTGSGDVTGKALWHRGGKDFNRTIASAVVHDGIVYAADLSGFVYAFDAKTGQEYWKHDNFAAIWGSPMVADNKVFLGDEDGDLAILATGKTMKVLNEINMGSSIYTTPNVQDGVLYVLTRNRLVAIKAGAKSEPVKAGAQAASSSQID
jgi:outer membrane protein assembly factor BamB